MADRVAEIIYGQTGQIVECYPPETEGVPSSATVKVFAHDASDDDTEEFAPSVTVDAVATNVNAASGYSQAASNRLYVASTASMTVGRAYLATNTGTQHEWFVPASLDATYVTTQDPLCYDYVSGNAVKGLRMTFTVDATWVADEDNISPPTEPPYRVVWTYTVGGIVRRHLTYLRLVRAAFKPNVHQIDLEALLPELGEDEPANRRGQQYGWLIGKARDRVRADLSCHEIEPSQVRDTELVDNLVRQAAFYEAGLSGRAPQGWEVAPWTDRMKADYDSLLGRVIAGARLYLDRGSEGSASEARTCIWFKG